MRGVLVRSPSSPQLPSPSSPVGQGRHSAGSEPKPVQRCFRGPTILDEDDGGVGTGRGESKVGGRRRFSALVAGGGTGCMQKNVCFLSTIQRLPVISSSYGVVHAPFHGSPTLSLRHQMGRFDFRREGSSSFGSTDFSVSPCVIM